MKSRARTFILGFLFVALSGGLLGCDTNESDAQDLPDSGTIEIDDGAEIFYQAEGDGAPMLLVHGYPLTGDLFREQREALSDEYRVVTPTLRGYGQSTAPDSTADIETYASDMLTLMDELGVEEAIIGGMSMGGPIVFEMYRQAPERFRGMLLIDTTPAPAIPAEAGLWRGVAAQVRQEGVPSLVPFLLKDMLTGDTRMNEPALAEDLSAMIEAASSNAAIAGAKALRTRPDSRETLGQIDVPTLIFTGVEDTIYPFETAQSMDEQISNSTLALPAGASHAAIIEADEEANEAISDWASDIGDDDDDDSDDD